MQQHYSTLLQEVYYSYRFCIEETFRDWKSCGFNLEKNHIQVADRLSRLLFCVCIAHLCCLSFGTGILKQGNRRDFERQKVRRLSIFQLGFRYLIRSITLGKPFKIKTIIRRT
jgi:hypothetical protein